MKWIANLLKELDYDLTKPIVLFTDSQNARLAALNPLNTARTRHIDIRYKWVIWQVREGFLDIRQIGTTEMAADGLTKGLRTEKHSEFGRMIGLTA